MNQWSNSMTKYYEPLVERVERVTTGGIASPWSAWNVSSQKEAAPKIDVKQVMHSKERLLQTEQLMKSIDTPEKSFGSPSSGIKRWIIDHIIDNDNPAR